MMSKFENLCSPIQYGSITLKNRMVLAPASVHMSHDGSVTEQELAYVERRAIGGAGLLIIGSVLIQPDGDFGGQLYLDTDERIPGLRKLVDAAHKHGAKISAQIQHSGRETSARASGYQPIAPSIFEPETDEFDLPRELSTKEVELYVEHYAQAVRRAKEAGFDSVEFHCAHGYLISQFISPLTNKRTDKYGGSFINRMKFITEIFARTKALVGDEFPISCRISGDELRPGGIDMELACKVAVYLEKLGAVALSVSAEMWPFVRTVPNMSHRPGVNVYLADYIKAAASIPVQATGRINTPELAEEILIKGKADLIGMSRVLMADPDFPLKVEQDRADEIIPCIGCNKGCFNRGLEDRSIKCTMNIETGREHTFTINEAETAKKIMIVGGGPAGMAAAKMAAERGHKVTLYERNNTLGGRINIAAIPPGKADYKKSIDYLQNKIDHHDNIRIVLNREIKAEDILRENPDVVIVATGASPVTPKIQGADLPFVVTADEILNGAKKAGDKVVVIGGGAVGTEVAHWLMETSPRHVYLIEMLSDIGMDLNWDSKIILRHELEQMQNLKIYTCSKVVRIEEKSVLVDKVGKEELIEKVDTVVLAVGAKSNNELISELYEYKGKVHIVGDADSPRDLVKAIFEGATIANNV